MSKPEELLEFQLRASKIYFKREYLAIPNRKFRFDFYCYDHRQEKCAWKKVLVEIQGGQWAIQNGKRSAHVGGYGMQRDCEKQSLAAIEGFRVIVCTPSQVKSGQALAWIEAALGV